MRIGKLDNDTLNALEWHKSSEVHCALEDMVLLLGDMRDMKDGVFDTKNIKAFSVKKGESVEIYQTTLHFCPVLPCGGVFKNVVILPRGTNTPLTKQSGDKKLVARNKWLICHPECKKQTELGRVAAQLLAAAFFAGFAYQSRVGRGYHHYGQLPDVGGQPVVWLVVPFEAFLSGAAYAYAES